MKSFDGGSAGSTGEQAHGEVEGAPPRVDRRGAPAVGGAKRGEHEGGLGGRREVVGRLGWVVGGVVVVLVQRRRPRSLLRCRVDLHRADEVADRGQQSRVTSATGRSGASGMRWARPSLCSATASWRCRSSATTSAPEPSGAGSGSGLPPAGAEAQRGVLQLRFGRRQRRGQLAEHLGVRVQRVAGGMPRLIGQLGPPRRHGSHLGANVAGDAGPVVRKLVVMGVPARTASVTGVRSATSASRSRCSGDRSAGTAMVRSIDACPSSVEVVANVDLDRRESPSPCARRTCAASWRCRR